MGFIADCGDLVKKVAPYVAAAGAGYIVYQKAKNLLFFLDNDEQLVMVELTKTSMKNGPGIVFVSPLVKGVEMKKAPLLEPTDYVRVRDKLSGQVRVEVGPKLLFLGAYDEVQEQTKGTSLTPIQYCVVMDVKEGVKRIEKGPKVLFPGPYEEIYETQQATSLGATQFVNLLDSATGKRWSLKGECVLYLEPTWAIEGGVKEAISLKKIEYVRLIDAKTGQVRVERGEQMVFPGPTESFLDLEGKKTAINLKASEYCTIIDNATGVQRNEKGEQLIYLAATEELYVDLCVSLNPVREAISLSKIEYVRFYDSKTGCIRVERGEQLVFPEPTEKLIDGDKLTAINLKASQYVRILDTATGVLRVEKGEQLLFMGATDKMQSGVEDAISLKQVEYVRLIDSNSGKIRVEHGEQMVFPGPNEACLDPKGKLTAINLKIFEYVKILDTSKGVLRVERGEKTITLDANEQLLEGVGKKTAIEIDQETAVLIRNKKSGAQELVTAHGLYIPKAEEDIIQVQQMIKLADYECVIIKNKAGVLEFFYGDDKKRGDKPRAFFVPPHSEVFELCWSKGRRRDCRNLNISKLDCRPQFMNFEFNCRTSDNVELVLEGTFFWQIEDVEIMTKMTGDTTGDICSHARSKFIGLVSKATLKEFMGTFNNIAAQAHATDDEFYAKRGVSIHTLEVTRYQCADSSTALILEQIIQETTNRMNRMSQQDSANEINMARLEGDIKQEKAKSDLIKVKNTHDLMNAASDGNAEAEKVRKFMESMKDTVPDLKQRIGLWNVLRKKDAVQAVANGNSRLYFTPNDVNLTIETQESRMFDSPSESK